MNDYQDVVIKETVKELVIEILQTAEVPKQIDQVRLQAINHLYPDKKCQKAVPVLVVRCL